jgi:protein gp37
MIVADDLIQKGLFWTKGVMLVTGCGKVSPGCANCWSETAHARRSKWPPVQGIYNPDLLTDGRFNGKVQFNLRLLEQAAKAKKPQVYAIWNDLYHEGVTDEQRDNAFGIMMAHTHHKYLIVTKRPEVAAKYHAHPDIEDRWVEALNEYKGGEYAFSGECSLKDWPHIWHIVTAENQKRLEQRMPHILRIPGKRGIIIEPMLGGIELGGAEDKSTEENHGDIVPWLDDIHQVILGGETGTNARPMHLDDARSVRDQCAAADVPFFFKSWGDNRPFKRITDKRALDGQEHNALAWNGEG